MRRRTIPGRYRERVELLKRIAPSSSSSSSPTNRTLGYRWASIQTFEQDPLGDVPAPHGALTLRLMNDSLTRTVRINDRVWARGELWQVKGLESGPRHVMPDIILHVETATT